MAQGSKLIWILQGSERSKATPNRTPTPIWEAGNSYHPQLSKHQQVPEPWSRGSGKGAGLACRFNKRRGLFFRFHLRSSPCDSYNTTWHAVDLFSPSSLETPYTSLQILCPLQWPTSSRCLISHWLPLWTELTWSEWNGELRREKLAAWLHLTRKGRADGHNLLEN